MKAKFIGENGSMGLKNEKVYRIWMKRDDQYIWVHWSDRRLFSYSKTGKCSYSNMEEVLENWEIEQ